MYLPEDIKECIKSFEKKETDPVGRNILKNLELNYRAAEKK